MFLIHQRASALITIIITSHQHRRLSSCCEKIRDSFEVKSAFYLSSETLFWNVANSVVPTEFLCVALRLCVTKKTRSRSAITFVGSVLGKVFEYGVNSCVLWTVSAYRRRRTEVPTDAPKNVGERVKLRRIFAFLITRSPSECVCYQIIQKGSSSQPPIQ